MDQRDSYCPYLQFSELTVEGTVSIGNVGKEDPIELDSRHDREVILKV